MDRIVNYIALVEMNMFDKFRQTLSGFFTDLADVFRGAIGEESHKELVLREIVKLDDVFILLVFGDIIGLQSPSPYLTLKLLPYVAAGLPEFISRVRFYDCTEVLSAWESFF